MSGHTRRTDAMLASLRCGARPSRIQMSTVLNAATDSQDEVYRCIKGPQQPLRGMTGESEAGLAGGRGTNSNLLRCSLA